MIERWSERRKYAEHSWVVEDFLDGGDKFVSNPKRGDAGGK
jgi:hypothetical protein